MATSVPLWKGKKLHGLPIQLITVFLSTLARLDSTDGKIESLLRPLSTLHSADLICHLWQQYVNIALFPLGNSSVAIRREMTVFNSQNVSRIEGAANQVVQRSIDGPPSLHDLVVWLILESRSHRVVDCSAFQTKED
jgi:hypothetical protein